MSVVSRESEFDGLRRRLDEAEETLRAIRSGEVDALVVEGTDGERVYTLDGAERPYRALIESMQQGAVTLSDDGTVLYCNRCFAAMVHQSQEKIVGAAFNSYLPRVDRPTFQAFLQRANIAGSQDEFELKSVGDALLSVNLALSLLSVDDNVIIGIVVTDLTDLKIQKDLLEANRRKDEFLAMLAHELRNPLAPIRNAVAILNYLDSTDEKLIYSRNIIDRQVTHLTRLVDDLLDVSRITRGMIDLVLEPVELAVIIAQAVETSRSLFEARNQQFTVVMPPLGLRVRADATRLAQVVSNLLNNAAKYTDDGGLIVLETEREGAEFLIRVRDNGIGIPAELLPCIFDLFIQGNRALARSEGGLGIGLTLVRRLVEMHEGTVEAHSHGLGTGSQFVVRLPSLEASAESPAEPATQRIGQSGTNACRILVVDDNKDNANSLAKLLQFSGHEVQVSYDGLQGLEMARSHRPQIVLLDIGLPGMSGYEIAGHIRATSGLEKTLLIAMTGYAQEEDKARSLRAGFDRHLCKPVAWRELDEILKSFTSARAAR
jgi:PAS domain S-box-containing protein